MINETDSRHSTRMDESGEISYKFPDAERTYIAACLNLSGAGILFRAEHPIESGKALEVTIDRPNGLTSSMVAYVEVIRSHEVGPGEYEVATEIKGIKEI